MYDFIDEAREQAVQCWCDKETSDWVMDPVLCEAIAQRIAAWMQIAAQNSRNTDYYVGLLDRIAMVFGQDAYISDDGSVQEEPLRAKMPELVERQAAELAAQQAVPIHIVFDGPPSPEAGRFVETETPGGQGVGIGRWIAQGNGYWALEIRIPRGDVNGPN
jgi:hypothetical protein